MSIATWTDADYAQAALDMLPERVEEIAEFLKAQGIESKWEGGRCPIQRWVGRWMEGITGVGTMTVNIYTVLLNLSARLSLPFHARKYIDCVDRGYRV